MIRTAAVLAALVLLSPALAADPTAEEAYALVARSAWSRDPLPKPEELAAARRVLEAQAAKEPSSARWTFALGRAAGIEAEQAPKDKGAAKREAAVALLEKASKAQPANADYLFWYGSAVFERIDDVGMLSKMSLASDGRKAYEKAVALDPSHVGARVGLSQFYLGAPGIAGGSKEKAAAQGQALLAIPGGRGEFQGRLVLARVAAEQENWAEMTRQLTAAETAKGDGADTVGAVRMLVWSLLNVKKDPQAALPAAERYVKIAPADDLTALFFDGEVKRQLGRCADALPRYDQVIAKFPDARGSRWGAAVCQEQLGKKAEAKKNYEEYARRFPNDDRAKEAKAAAKRLAGP